MAPTQRTGRLSYQAREHFMMSFKTPIAFFLFVGATACTSSSELESCDTVGEFRCTEGEILEECSSDGWDFKENCEDLNMMCHAEMGHCMAMDDDHDHEEDHDGM